MKMIVFDRSTRYWTANNNDITQALDLKKSIFKPRLKWNLPSLKVTLKKKAKSGFGPKKDQMLFKSLNCYSTDNENEWVNGV